MFIKYTALDNRNFVKHNWIAFFQYFCLVSILQRRESEFVLLSRGHTVWFIQLHKDAISCTISWLFAQKRALFWLVQPSVSFKGMVVEILVVGPLFMIHFLDVRRFTRSKALTVRGYWFDDHTLNIEFELFFMLLTFILCMNFEKLKTRNA